MLCLMNKVCHKLWKALRLIKYLKVELQYMGNSVPLPPWFVSCCDAKPNHFNTSFKHFPAYITNVAGDLEVYWLILENWLTSQKGDHHFLMPLLDTPCSYGTPLHRHVE